MKTGIIVEVFGDHGCKEKQFERLYNLKYTPEDIKAALESGMKSVEIARQLGKSKNAISSFMKRYGIKRKKLELSPELLEDRISIQGKTQQEVADELDINVSTIYRFISRHGLKLDVCKHCSNRFHAITNTQKWCSDSCRFWSNVNIQGVDECWSWMGNFKTDKGYGRFPISSKKSTTAPRFAYVDSKGEIPEGHEIRHKCDNPSCCNPSHLETGTRADNMRDCSERGRIVPGRKKGDERYKVTKDNVEKMKRLHKSGLGYKKIQKLYFSNVHYTTIARHIKGQVSHKPE